MPSSPPKLIKISEIAERAGVSLATIKHYVKEGLLPKPVKTGKTMAYYDASCVDRILRIKKLQKEKFMPLEVIRMVIDSGPEAAEEVELGQAMVRPQRFYPSLPPVSERQLEKQTGYPLSRIRVLERMGLVFPSSGEGGKSYDAVDCRIIELVKFRENLGVPFDYTLQTLTVYRDALRQAVQEDARLFVETLLGDIPTREAVKFVTEADESLDHFLVLIRQKLTRSLSRVAIQQTSTLREKLPLLNPFPVPGRNLPVHAPRAPAARAFYLFCRGSFSEIASKGRPSVWLRELPESASLSVLAHLFAGDTKAARGIAESRGPSSAARPLENLTAALAYLFSVPEAPGFSDPIYLMKRVLGHLKRLEVAVRRRDLTGMACGYVCGAAYTLLPGLFDTWQSGIRILKELGENVRDGRSAKVRLPPWGLATLQDELLPALEIRINLFLAEAFQKSAEPDQARRALSRITEIAEADSEFAAWARLEKLKLRHNKGS